MVIEKMDALVWVDDQSKNSNVDSNVWRKTTNRTNERTNEFRDLKYPLKNKMEINLQNVVR